VALAAAADALAQDVVGRQAGSLLEDGVERRGRLGPVARVNRGHGSSRRSASARVRRSRVERARQVGRVGWAGGGVGLGRRGGGGSGGRALERGGEGVAEVRLRGDDGLAGGEELERAA